MKWLPYYYYHSFIHCYDIWWLSSVLVTLMIAFTNYDFKHTGSNKLALIGSGFQNFTNMEFWVPSCSAFTSVPWTFDWALAKPTLQIVLGIWIKPLLLQTNHSAKGKAWILGLSCSHGLFQPSITILTFSNMFNDSVMLSMHKLSHCLRRSSPFWWHLILGKTDPTWTKFAGDYGVGWLGPSYIYVLTWDSSNLFQTIFTKSLLMVPTVKRLQNSTWHHFPNDYIVAFPTLINNILPTLITSIIYLFKWWGT